MNNKDKKNLLTKIENKDKQINKLQIEIKKLKTKNIKQKLKNKFSKKCLSKGTQIKIKLF